MPINQVIFLKRFDVFLLAVPLPQSNGYSIAFLRGIVTRLSVRDTTTAVFCLVLILFLPMDTVFAMNETKPPGQINRYLRINGEFLGSYESWNYFRSEPAADNSYDLWVLRARLGVMLSTPYVDGFAQAQYSGLYGLPDNAISSSNGPLGLGAAYFLANQSTDASNVFLKQGYLNFKFNTLGLPGATVKAGRFELIEGMEYNSGIEKFDGLKRRRIAKRLLGGFNAIYVGRSFDGFSGVYDRPEFNMTVSGVRPTQGNLTVDGQKQISDINILFAALTSKRDALLPGTEGRLFYMNYDDQRDTRVVDNRPFDTRAFLNHEKLNIHTIGAHLLSLQQLGPGSFDGLLWGAYQFGDWTAQSHQAWAVAAEAGYQWLQLPFKPWLRVVYYRSSGDSQPQDGKHQTFFSAVPSGRLYAKFPFYNMMNIQDTFVEIITAPAAKMQVNVNLHQLSLANSNDLLYGGLGAALGSGAFGYSGNSSGGHSDIGQLVDISVTYIHSKQFSARVYYGRALGGDVMKSIYPGKSDANNFLVDFNLVF